MGHVYNVFDKFSILNIIIGFVLGVYLAVNHNDSNLWFTAIKFIVVLAFIMTLIPTFTSIYEKIMDDRDIPYAALIEAYFLNFGMIGVCLAFGVVFGSFLIGNFIID